MSRPTSHVRLVASAKMPSGPDFSSLLPRLFQIYAGSEQPEAVEPSYCYVKQD